MIGMDSRRLSSFGGKKFVFSLDFTTFDLDLLYESFQSFHLAFVMRLKKLEIDGFKSYAKPVVVTDFDPSFNAITGLNGAGKSNCLDAICFVLGITQLKQVRAARWTDLIYKQAQAGVQKATVTATFEHNDPKHRISGFELGKDIIVRRQVCRYP